jgi:hypothetical protein
LSPNGSVQAAHRVVTPDGADATQVTEQFLIKVEEVIGWSVHDFCRNPILQWLEEGNKVREKGWLQKAIFGHDSFEKSLPGTNCKRLWLFNLFLLASGNFAGDGNVAESLGKAYGVVEQTIRNNNDAVLKDFWKEVEVVHSKKDLSRLSSDLDSLIASFKEYLKWKPIKKPRSNRPQKPNPIVVFLRKQLEDGKMRGWWKQLFLGQDETDQGISSKQKLLLFQLRAGINGEIFEAELLYHALDNNCHKFLCTDMMRWKSNTAPILVVSPPNAALITPIAATPPQAYNISASLISRESPPDNDNDDELNWPPYELTPVISNLSATLAQVATVEKAPAQTTTENGPEAAIQIEVAGEKGTEMHTLLHLKQVCQLPAVLETVETDDAIVTGYFRLTGKETHILLRSWAAGCVESSQDNKGIATLRVQGKRQQHDIKAAYLKKNLKKTEDLDSEQRKHRFKRFDGIVQHFVGNGSSDYFLKGYIAKHHPALELVDKIKVRCTVQEAITLREILRVSGKQFEKLDQFFRKFKGLRLFEPNIIKKLKAKEIKIVTDAEVTIKLLFLQVDKHGSKKLCVFWRVNNAIAILERQIESSMVEGKFLESEALGKLIHKILVVCGADKGGIDTTLLMRVANRLGGNNKDFEDVLAQYEDGQEVYANLAKTL